MRFAVLGLALLLAACASFTQCEDEVWKRESGGTLAYWRSLHDAAALHLPYALAAVAAYQKADDASYAHPPEAPECGEVEPLLHAGDWELWEDLPLLRPQDPAPVGRQQMNAVHLRAEVWGSEKTHQVVVAFGGTVATNRQDLITDLHWFIAPFHPADSYEDQYTVVSRTFVPAFIAAYRKRSAAPDGAWLASARIVATGHSLGGGLAQHFAYAFNETVGEGPPRVREVYAFDTSPVSAKRSVPDWQKAAKDLTIYRIYNRGEIVAGVRALFMLYEAPPESEGQTWIDFRYLDDWSWRTLSLSGSVHAHQMAGLACFMKHAVDVPPREPRSRACASHARDAAAEPGAPR